jgi:uncharacterized Tic20 family protein
MGRTFDTRIHRQQEMCGMSNVPSGFASSEERGWVLFAHFGGIVLFFVAPLVALKVKGDQSRTILDHATRALNFQITWGLAFVIAFIIRVCTFDVLSFLPFAVWLFIAVCCVIAGLRANDGRSYAYPLSLDLVR